MKRRPIRLISNIQLIFFISMLLLVGISLFLQITSHNIKFKKQSEYIQSSYVKEQQAIIKREVERVVEFVDDQMLTIDDQIEHLVRQAVSGAHSIAENIYINNRNIKSDREIQEMIKDALRPIRFEDNLGYLFITSYSGVEILFPDRPEMEGLNLIDLQDTQGKYVIRDMIQICRESGEGLYDYLWTKPEAEGNDHQKTSFIKYFEPYDWIIGAGLYIEDVNERIMNDILYDVSRIRFSQEGYIFVNTLDAFALVANGNLMDGDLKLWEVFSKNPDKTKDLFQKEYDAALKPDGDYIYYSINKLSDSETESPKSSFIYGMPELNWLIGAGLYLDDIESEIAELQKISYIELRLEIKNTILLTGLLIIIFLFLFYLIGRRLQKDFLLFTNFFDRAVFNDIEIDLENVKFKELIIMADRANKMQSDKINAQLKLEEEKEKLKISENKFRLLAENSKDMIFRMTFPDGHYDYISPASQEIVGYTPQEIMAEPYHVRKVIHPDWKEWLENKFTDIMNGHIDDTFEYQIVDKSGKEIWVTQKNRLIKDEHGQVTALVGRLSNETLRKKIEEQLNHSTRMDAIGQLAGGVAHDFNNVLSGIISASQVLKSPKREIDEKGRKMVDLIMSAAVRASDLTSKLSAFSRKKTLMLKPLDVHPLIDETASILKRTIDKKIRLIIDKIAQNSIVTGDGSGLQSAILNLGINASHAMPDGGEIQITTSNISLNRAYCDGLLFDIQPGVFIQIEVKDNGTGINNEDRKRIFEPFFSTKEQGKGTGLGLATVYRAVLDHHGAILVESELGKGTVFRMLLPISFETPEIPASHREIVQGDAKILLVDDEEIIRFTGQNMLEDMGYTVFVAENGKQAVDLYRSRSGEIDLVVMDMIMPEMNGHEAFYKMREINPQCRIIIISGYTRYENIEELQKDGLSGFLKKPFSDVALNKMIEDVLRE